MRISKQGKKKYKMYSLWRKRESGTIMLEPNPGLKQIRSLKKSLILNVLKEMVPPGQNPTQLSFQLVKGNYGKLKLQGKPATTESLCKGWGRFQLQQAEALGSFGHMVLDLETRGI